MDENLIERRRPYFEAWALANVNFRNPIARCKQGDYLVPVTHVAWDVWNAALDSAVVELPDVHEFQSASAQHWKCAEAIERAGLRVKS